MKECPDCGVKNDEANMFCPVCGYCFIPEKAKSESPSKGGGRRFVAVTAVIVVILGATAGLVSYYVSREIERSKKVVVETGTVWECRECGREYRRRVFEVEVEKKDVDRYSVEVVEGECYRCLYGPVAGGIQELLTGLSEEGFFHGQQVEMQQEAAEFIRDQEGLFPASDVGEVDSLAERIDPRRVERDFDELAGKPIYFRGKVVASETFQSDDGSEYSYLQLIPLQNGDELEAEYLVFTPNVSDPLRGDEVDCYSLPLAITQYQDDTGTHKAVVAAGMYVTVGR